MSVDEPAVTAFLRRSGLAGPDETFELEPLAGGVSSDIWRVSTRARTLCVKRALARLRVARPWEAPTSRNAAEWAWLARVAKLDPAYVPALYAHDASAGMFAMEYLDPQPYPVWKAQLRDGEVSPATAAAVGRSLGAIHAATAGDPALAAEFANDATFFALRLQPYLLATAQLHPRLERQLRELVDVTAATRRVLVHGDVSPKNILIGPAGPVFLDAECAWYGDPAFDLAFVLNHLLLKCVWRPASTRPLIESFYALAATYFQRVAWEDPLVLETRTARLLPGLMLARVDGTSPVEYLAAERDREAVRAAATSMLDDPPASLHEIADRWQRTAVTAE